MMRGSCCRPRRCRRPVGHRFGTSQAWLGKGLLLLSRDLRSPLRRPRHCPRTNSLMANTTSCCRGSLARRCWPRKNAPANGVCIARSRFGLWPTLHPRRFGRALQRQVFAAVVHQDRLKGTHGLRPLWRRCLRKACPTSPAYRCAGVFADPGCGGQAAAVGGKRTWKFAAKCCLRELVGVGRALGGRCRGRGKGADNVATGAGGELRESLWFAGRFGIWTKCSPTLPARRRDSANSPSLPASSDSQDAPSFSWAQRNPVDGCSAFSFHLSLGFRACDPAADPAFALRH